MIKRPPAPNDKEKDGERPDNSLAADDDDMEELEEDEKVGGLSSAIDVWLTAIKYMAALHATVDDPFDEGKIQAHATNCKGAHGHM